MATINELPEITEMNDDDLMMQGNTLGKLKKITWAKIWESIGKKIDEWTSSDFETEKKTITGAVNEVNNKLSVGNFFGFSVGRGTSKVITKKAYHSWIIVEFRGTHANVITIDQWNNIGRITGGNTGSKATIDIANPDSAVETTVTFNNTNGTSGIYYWCVDAAIA